MARRLAVWAIVLMSCAALRARADYQQSFLSGLQARDAMRWSDVVAHMTAAAGEQPVEGETIRTRDLRDLYLPYYYLGEAQAQQRNCTAAVAAWSESLRQGAIRRNARLFVRLRKGMEACAKGSDPRIEWRPPRRPYVQGVPSELVEAAAAFLDGHYEHVREVLRGATFDEPRLAAQRHLLLAAADYTLFVLGGGSDADLRESAAQNIRRCRRVDYSVTPRREIFSPGFIDFFNDVR
jgi:hypothetical protein